MLRESCVALGTDHFFFQSPLNSRLYFHACHDKKERKDFKKKRKKEKGKKKEKKQEKKKNIRKQTKHTKN